MLSSHPVALVPGYSPPCQCEPGPAQPKVGVGPAWHSPSSAECEPSPAQPKLGVNLFQHSPRAFCASPTVMMASDAAGPLRDPRDVNVQLAVGAG